MKEERKPVAIILPAYNSHKSIQFTIDSLLSSTEYPLELIIIESESTDGTAELCDEYAKKDKRIRVIHTKKEGPTKAINIGIKEAGDLDVFLTQTDVVFPKKHESDWLEEMTITSKLDDCGLITVHDGGGISGDTYINGLHWIGTWSTYIPRKVINIVGLFDEENFSEMNNGMGDDIDYTYRVCLAGLKNYYINYWTNHHRLINAHVEEVAADTAKHAELFRKKWGITRSSIINFNIDGVIRAFNVNTLLDAGYNLDALKTSNGIPKEDRDIYVMIISIAQKMNDDDIMIDVGAGVGDTSVWVDKGTCFAFEPSVKTYQHLLTNIRLNPKSRVVPMMNAVYSKPIHYEIKEGAHYGLNEIVETNDTTNTQTIVLDEMFRNFSNIRLIKIDAEGADYEVFQGAIDIIKKHRPVIIIEINHITKPEIETITKTLLELNYNLDMSTGINIIGIQNKVLE